MLVIDASVAIKWYIEEVGSQDARVILAERQLIAPRFLLIEFSNVLSKLVRRGTLLAEVAQDYCGDLPAAISFPVPDDSLIKPALDLAVRHNHAVYHCLYVALAIREHAQLVTADRPLAKRFSTIADIRLL